MRSIANERVIDVDVKTSRDVVHAEHLVEADANASAAAAAAAAAAAIILVAYRVTGFYALPLPSGLIRLLRPDTCINEIMV